MKPSRSEFHAIRGLRYHVRTWGEAHHPRLFLLHGWMDVSASFQFLVDSFERDWYVVAPDWRGFGLTQWSREGYWFPDYYADLDALLDLYQPGTAVNLVGHSMGGNIVVTYAGLRPERIARLATLEGLGMGRTQPDLAPKRMVQWMDSQLDPPQFRAYKSFDEVAERLKAKNSRLTGEQAQFLARQWAHETDGAVVLRSDPRHKAPNPYLFRIEEALAIWRCITVPILLVSGKDSQVTKRFKGDPEGLAERKGALRDLREVELENCGHMMHHDQPERLARVLEGFLTSESLEPPVNQQRET